MKIVVSRPIPGKAHDLLEQSGHDVTLLADDRSQEDFNRAFREAHGAVSMLSDPIDATLLASSPNLIHISNYAVGFNNIDLNACAEHGIMVSNTPDVLTDATADLTMLLILAVMRRGFESAKYLAGGGFTGWKPDLMLGRDLKNKNLGILGMGRIGQAVARRAVSFGMKILYHSRSAGKAFLPYPYVSLETLLRESDVLSLHLPLTPQSHHLISLNEFQKMKKDAILVNTSRGPIVDEEALVKVLKESRLFGAGLDVFEKEPLIHDGLKECPNAVLLPHIGSATIETRSAMGEIVANSLLAVLNEKTPQYLVNPEVLESENLVKRHRSLSWK